MFKLESYITPILLSYVDKYIKNFRPEDSQLSLWGGDASFHNLDLRLEVLEQELQLPFSFVSGHIHELLIHVPWTKIGSEPITITINTIECILKLRGVESSVNTDRPPQVKEKQKRNINKRQTIEAPPGYVQLLINKIVSNIRIYCNNLILKYVEEDIVLSMNVKLLTFESANEKWEPAYTDVFPAKVLLRKLIAINDLTVCLDKRNASGKIDVYQEPMLYRCSMVIHFLRSYHTSNVKSSSITRLDIYCNSMEFSMTEQQIPMLLRLIFLLHALQQRQLKSDIEVNADIEPVMETTGDYHTEKQSLAGWAWSFVPSILPTHEDSENEFEMANLGHTMHIGFYVDNASLTFKVSESSSEKSGYYSQRKIKYWPVLTLNLQGIFMDSIMHGKQWVQVSTGISQMVLLPLGLCTCATQDISETAPTIEYLKAGSVSMIHKSDSLFDVEAPENKGQRKNYNISWDRHIEMTTEAALLERSPAFAIDYLYQLIVPDDMTSESLSELGSDLEYSNLSERALLRLVVGPLRLRLCSGFIHRVSSLQAAASAYDYIPYSIPKPEPELQDLPPPSEDDFDALNENIPTRILQVTVLAPVIEFQLMDHPYFQATKGYLFKKRKKISTHIPPNGNAPIVDLPKITLECQCVDLRIGNPMYFKRLVRTTCQLPEPPEHMFNACHTDFNMKVIGFCSRLIIANRQITILTPSSASYHSRTIIMPQYWVSPNIPHQEITFNSDSITITGTYPKIIIVSHIIDKFTKMDCQDSLGLITNSSLLQDATKNYGLVYLEFCIEGIHFRKVTTNSSVSIKSTLGSVKAFIFEPIDFSYNKTEVAAQTSTTSFYSTREIQQVLIVSGPELEDDYKNGGEPGGEALFSLTVQFPLNPEKQTHPPIVLFNVREVRVCADPLLCRWLLYAPRNLPPKTEVLFETNPRRLSRSFSDISTHETPRRSRTPYESIHSSLDQSTYLPPKLPANASNEDDDGIDFQERTYNFLKRWFDVWKGLLLFGDISQCTIYLPVKSLSAVGSQGIQQAVEEAMTKQDPPDIFILTLPSATIRNSSHRDNLVNLINDLPISLPDYLWTKHKSSFPWSVTVSDFCCYTWQNGERVNCLAPVSLTSTVGMSTKCNVRELQDTNLENRESITNINLPANKNDIGSLGVCIHIDMTPIVVSVSELQVCLIASILHGLVEVAYNIMPDSTEEPAKTESVVNVPAQESAMSPTLLKSVESVSEKTPHVYTDELETDNIKLTAWIQWTITKFSVELLAHDSREISVHDFKYSKRPKLKFVVDAEDIVSSLDFQSVYLKLKSKIGTASVTHYIRDAGSDKWKLGDFLGFVMRANEEHWPADRQEDTSFANITVTRASCQHTHNLWGTNKKNKPADEKDAPQIYSRYITEIVVNLQPIDILVSPTTLKNYFLVIEPLLKIPPLPSKPKKIITDTLQMSNRTLPLFYLEFHGFRIIMPSAELGNVAHTAHDTCVFQIKRINLTPSAVNPICRNPCRPDIYQQAAQARILNIPGSDVEDRQYELDVVGISMNTGTWNEISQILQYQGKSMSVLRTMSENPALEWNSLGKAKLSNSPDVTFWPIIGKFDITVVAAPAMIYKHDVVCGHSIEINFISDIKLTISLGQIRLLVSLLNESSYVFGMLTSNSNSLKRPKVIFPYPHSNHNIDSFDEVEIELMDATRDSGFETSDLRSTSFSIRAKDNLYLKKTMDVSEKSAYTSMQASPGFGRQVLSLHSFVPLDVLITGGRISLVVYDYDEDHRSAGFPFIKNAFENESDRGYEASEEGSSDERPSRKHSCPLLYFLLSQPNAFLSDTPLGRKIQISCFDVCMKISEPSHRILKGIPGAEDFGISLLETKSGEPHPDTGVLPAFFTLKWSKGIGKQATLDLEIAKPTQLICSISRCKYLLNIQERVLANFKMNFNFVVKQDLDITKKDVEVLNSVKSTDYYSKFKEIKQRFMGISHFNIKLAQIILTLETDHGIELTFSLARMENYLSIYNRPEKLTNSVSFECITVGLKRDGGTKLILNPWTLNFEVTLFWESWQNANSNPQIQLSGESDCVILDVSPDKIQCLQLFIKELNYLIGNLPASKGNSGPVMVEAVRTPVGEKEQHYKDDLRAGAFQFVDSSSNNIDELPLPYQVMFWNRNISAMAWRYPQPRALTKVRVFPVPFKISTGNEEDQQVLCHLEYWSDCHGCYQSYTQFYLSETDMCHLELPKNYPQPAVACTWRVVLTTPSIKDYNQSRVLISPRALAGCIRVDSYFNKNLIPELTMALHVGSVQINLYNYFDKKSGFNLPEPLKNYTPDLFVPDYQQFLTLSIDNANAYLATWNFETAVFDVSTTTKCHILDYNFLTQQLLLEPFSSKLEISVSKTLGVNFISKPVHVLFGASAAHTLAVSTQMWSQYMNKTLCDDGVQDLIVMTNYVICNDTNVNLRFGQAGMEDIFLPSRFCHLYTWRSQKCKQMIRIALEEKRWVWSEPFKIDADGTEMCKIADETAVIIITVKSLSATQKQVTFSGQLIVCNTLVEHFELKILECTAKGNDREFKLTQSYIIRGKTTPPSMLIDCKKSYFLRLRFFGLESAWSGDIPLKENTKCAQPWLVKVPLQERGQFLSIWCRIVVQPYPKGKKILAMLWPLFMIRSNLPIGAKVHIETPTLNVHLESTVRGLGEYQQLYCPGTIDHSHQLTFHLDNSTTTKNPYVPLNYSLVDQKQFFKKEDNEDINEILERINDYDKSNWPYFSDESEETEFTADEQPLTHVQVRYQNACEYSSALLVELLPWCLLANTLGCSIAIIVNEKELCRVPHLGIVTPPKLEETFHIGVGIGGTWNMSPSLQLAKSNWSQTFYMPQITGTIPVDGNIKTVVKCDPYICVVSINSNLENEIRLLKIASSHVLTSYLKLQLQVVCFAVPETQTDTHLPRHFEKHAVALAPHLNKSNTGISIIQWYSLGKNNDENTNYALYISISTNSRKNWTCPVRVDNGLIRKSVAIQNEDYSIPIVVVTQELKGQNYISLHHDLHPQLLIENRSGTKIYCAQSGGEQSVTVNDSEHFNWLCAIEDTRSCYYSMPIVSERFPELPQINYPETLVLASDPEGDPQGFLWSTPINVTSFNDQFVRIPFYGDVKVSVKYSVHTINVIVESVSQVEISARDIRIRLSMHENENISMRQGRKEITHDLKKVDSSTTIGSTYFSAEESISSSSTDLLVSGHPRLEVMPASSEKSTHHHSALEREGATRKYLSKDCSSLRVLVFVKSVAFTLTSDLENGGAEKTEVASLTCDNISLSVNQAEVSEFCLSISDIQVDNQVYARGSYDFPVIVCGRESKQTNNLKTLNVPITQLVHKAQNNFLFKIEVMVETWKDLIQKQSITDVREIKVDIQPLSMYVEDIYVIKLFEVVSVLLPTKLLMWPRKCTKSHPKIAASSVSIPAHLLCGASILANPLTLNSFQIETINLLLSVHSSIKLYIALDRSPLQFGRVEKNRLFTTNDRLGHALAMHYLSGAIFGAGWVVGSLELLGSPGGLARAMGTGLRDFVTLPYHGFIQGPWAFLRGVSYGSASLMRHVTAGTLQSLTKLASSVARNLDRLTLDEDHLRRTEEFRRQRPQGVTQGFLQGLTGLGISLLGAVGGIAHHPLQSVMAEGASPKSLVAGVGKGIVGVFTKPLSGAAELVALTGQGLLQGAGWNSLPEPRMKPVLNHIFSTPNSLLKYKWKFIQTVSQSNILFVTEATAITNTGQYDAVALVLTTEALVIVDIDEDMSQRVLGLSELTGLSNNDQSLLCIKLDPPKVNVKQTVQGADVEMDPVSRARVADYVRSTVGLMQFPESASPEHSEMSISPDLSPCGSPNGSSNEHTTLTFYVNPQSRNYFLCVLALAKQQTLDYNFPVL